MKFVLRVSLPCTRAEAFDALHDPEVFQRVSRPFLTFRALDPTPFPALYQSGQSYVVGVKVLGFLPLGSQEINPSTSEEGGSLIFRDNGRGLSGPLSLVSIFHHTMTLHPDREQTILEDQLEFRAGLLTPFLGLGFRLFWWWRHHQMKRLAPGWRSSP